MKTSFFRPMVLLAVISLLVLPATALAGAEVSTQKFPVHAAWEDVDWCVPSMPVRVTLEAWVTAHTTVNNTGEHLMETWLWDTRVYELATGVQLTEDSGVQKYVTNINHSSFTDTFVFIARGWHAQAGSWQLTFTVHQTVKPDGTIAVFFNHVNLICG